MSDQYTDFKLPDAVIARIIKNSIPENASVGKIARKAISHSAAIFVLFTTTQAMRVAAKANRKMISGADVLKAMEEMDFLEFIPELEETLERFRAEQGLKNRNKEAASPAMGAKPTKTAPTSKENKKPGRTSKSSGGRKSSSKNSTSKTSSVDAPSS